MQNILTAGVFIAMVFATPVLADKKIKIDTVPSTYTPLNYSNSEDVTMSSYHFEVNQKTGRARVVVAYTYYDQISFGATDPGGGPRPTVAEVPGLTYDAESHTVVYNSMDTKAICATVHDDGGLLRHRTILKNTGACTVTTVAATHVDDSRWNTLKYGAIDTYLEVH